MQGTGALLALRLGHAAPPELIPMGRDERVECIAELAETRYIVEIRKPTDNASSSYGLDGGLDAPEHPAVRHHKVHCLHASIVRQARKLFENSRRLKVRCNESPSPR